MDYVFGINLSGGGLVDETADDKIHEVADAKAGPWVGKSLMPFFDSFKAL